MKSHLIFCALLVFTAQSCKRTPEPASVNTDLFSGTFKAKEVKEGNIVVYRNEGTTNIIPGYSKYRIAFVADTGKRTVRIT